MRVAAAALCRCMPLHAATCRYMPLAPIRVGWDATIYLVDRLSVAPVGLLIPIVSAMTDGQYLTAPEAFATALPAWLEPVADLVPETVVLHVEISGALVLIALVWLLLRPPWRGR